MQVRAGAAMQQLPVVHRRGWMAGIVSNRLVVVVVGGVACAARGNEKRAVRVKTQCNIQMCVCTVNTCSPYYVHKYKIKKEYKALRVSDFQQII